MTENKSTQKKRRKLKISHLIVILLLILIAVYMGYRHYLKSEVEFRLNSIRAKGYPVTFKEAEDWYSIPDGVENAASTYIAAFSYLRQWQGEASKMLPGVGKAPLPARCESMTEETKDLIAEYLEDNAETLELLHEAAALEHCRYSINLGRGIYATIPHLSDMRKSVMLLQLEAIYYSEHNNPQLTENAIASSFRLGNSLAKEPFLISQLARSSCQNRAVFSLEYAINKVNFTVEQLVRLSGLINEKDNYESISRALASERVFTISVFQMPIRKIPEMISRYRDLDSPGSVIASVALRKVTGMWYKDFIYYLDNMSIIVESAKYPSFESGDSRTAAKAQLREKLKANPLMHRVLPTFSLSINLNEETIARLLAARTALAVERYRLAEKKLPDGLIELVPDYLNAVPKDPFDGKNLRYTKSEKGYVVYSVGKDRIDDSGKERSKAKDDSSSYDITFIVER
ncbi:MAG: hypothetical protein ACYTBP_07535 [Planctomycetota bacterium]